jgi:hypothetical protein
VEHRPGQGLGPVRFGMTIAEVEEELGLPLSSAKESGICTYLVKEYAEGVFLFFDEEDNFRLSSMEVDNRSNCSLFGDALFPKSIRQISNLLYKNLGHHESERISVDRNDELEEARMDVYPLSMTFYFDPGDTLREVSWGPFFDAEDRIVWPKP